MTAVGKIQAHDAIVGLKKGSVDCEIGWRSGIGLDVDAPFLWVQFVSFQRTFLRENLDLINKLVSAVVSET